jgi:hypothetical protein
MALAEVGAGGHPGPATLELTARATYYLATAEVLSAPEPGSRVETPSGVTRPADKRYANQVLGEIVKSPQGIHTLFEACTRGRMNLRPPKVTEQGRVVVSVAGSAIDADKRWLRETFGARRAGADGGTSEISTVRPSRTPEFLLDSAVTSLAADVDAVTSRIKAIESVRDVSGTCW